MRVEAPDEDAMVDEFRRLAESVGAAVREGGRASIAADIGSPGDAEDGSLQAVIEARLGIAETGSVLIVHDDADSVRAMALARRLVVAVPRSSIVSSLLDAAPALEDLGRRHLTWTLLTGPS